MPEQTSSIISKVWGLCNPLWDNGVSDGDYLEQFAVLQQAEDIQQSILIHALR